jgi:predicted nuclease of restriction endonuclease-like RecB superfamily
MLTRQQRVYHWERQSSSISSDRLAGEDLPHLARALAVYRSMTGERLARVRERARAALSGLRPDRIEAVVQILDDAATYEWPRGGQAAARRLRVFEGAARDHPLLESTAALDHLVRVYGEAPAEHGDRVALLYADYPEFHQLQAFPADYSVEDLRADYDLGQAQALLYSALRVTVEARADLAHVVRYARLARLLHRIERMPGGGYRFALDGPNSILRHTHAYGVNFARFLAALVQARDWRFTAEIALRKGWRPLLCTLGPADGLRSRVPAPALFDSTIESSLAEKFGPERDGWTLRREASVLEAGDALLIPDFVFTHADGTEVLFEIVGYWTPEYLAEKFGKLGRVRAPNLLVAVPRARQLRTGPMPHAVLPFRTRVLLRDLLPRLEAFRARR